MLLEVREALNVVVHLKLGLGLMLLLGVVEVCVVIAVAAALMPCLLLMPRIMTNVISICHQHEAPASTMGEDRAGRHQ
jgi:hypothetical protein